MTEAVWQINSGDAHSRGLLGVISLVGISKRFIILSDFRSLTTYWIYSDLWKCWFHGSLLCYWHKWVWQPFEQGWEKYFPRVWLRTASFAAMTWSLDIMWQRHFINSLFCVSFLTALFVITSVCNLRYLNPLVSWTVLSYVYLLNNFMPRTCFNINILYLCFVLLCYCYY